MEIIALHFVTAGALTATCFWFHAVSCVYLWRGVALTYYRTQWTAEGSVFGAVSLWFFCLYMKYLRTGPACVVQWSYHLGAMSSRVWRAQCAAGPAFKSSRGLVRCVRLRKSNYLKIIPMHMMIREIIPRQATEGSTVSSVKCDRCWHLD